MKTCEACLKEQDDEQFMLIDGRFPSRHLGSGMGSSQDRLWCKTCRKEHTDSLIEQARQLQERQRAEEDDL